MVMLTILPSNHCYIMWKMLLQRTWNTTTAPRPSLPSVGLLISGFQKVDINLTIYLFILVIGKFQCQLPSVYLLCWTVHPFVVIAMSTMSADGSRMCRLYYKWSKYVVAKFTVGYLKYKPLFLLSWSDCMVNMISKLGVADLVKMLFCCWRSQSSGTSPPKNVCVEREAHEYCVCLDVWGTNWVHTR